MATTYKVLGQVATSSATRTIAAKQLGASIACITVVEDHNAAIGMPVTIASVSASNSVTTKALSSSVATLVLSGTNLFVVGQSVTVTGVDATFNGTYNLASVTGASIRYTKNAASVASQAATGTVEGLDSTFNGTYTVTATPTSKIFAYAKSSSVTVASTAATGSAVHSPWNMAYSCCPNTAAITSTLTVTNRSDISSGQYQLAISTSSTTPAAKDYIIYNDLVAANDMVALTLGLTVDATNKFVMFAGSQASMSFNIFGAETS